MAARAFQNSYVGQSSLDWQAKLEINNRKGQT